MCTNFDEMDIEPKSEPPVVRKKSPFSVDSTSKNDEFFEEELQSQLLLRTVPLDDGSLGYVFTCTKSGPLATWRCHACNFVDTWKNLVKHMDTKWHHDSMSKFTHSRSNFSKVENAIPDISKGQPLPPGMEDEISGPCQILKTLETYDQPLIGLEFLLELNIIELKEPRYLCLLCDKRGDPRSILVHLTSQSHYLMYLRKYFRKFYSLIDKLPKSNEYRSSVSTVTSHLIAKLEEKYGRLQPTATREDVINVPEQRTILLQKIDSSVHFSESPEDAYLEEMLTVEYVQNTHLLLKNFPLKPKSTNTEEKIDENHSKSLFKSSKIGYKKQLRNRDSDNNDHEESPDIVFMGSAKQPYYKRDHRDFGRERSPRDFGRERSPRDFGREPSSRSRSRHRSRTPEYKRRYISSSHYRSLTHHHSSRSRSPRRYRSRSRSPYDRHQRRSTPHPKYPNYKRRTPNRYKGRSPSPDIKSEYSAKYRGRSNHESPHHPHDRSPLVHRSRGSKYHSRSRSPGTESRILSSHPSSVPKEKEKIDENSKIAYLQELHKAEEKLNNEMKLYAEVPENHPAYQDEWKKFWCARFKELQAEGKVDPHTYDYKPEWIEVWNIRVKELFEEELQTQKKSLRLKYGFPEGMEENDILSIKKEKGDNLKPSMPFDDEKKTVVDIKTMWKTLTGCDIRETPIKRKSPSPWEEDNENASGIKNEGDSKLEATKKINNILDDSCTQPISPEPLSSISDNESLGRGSIPPRSRSRSFSPRSKSRSRSRSHSQSRSYSRERGFKEDYHSRKPSKKINFENPLNIITVLRQLSVLEFQLGSYASHVISLLSTGLSMEKIKPQSSVDLLTKDNVIFLELVKEKLKGQLLAGVVQKSMVKATLFCIKNIEELLLLAPKLKPTAPPPIPAPPPSLLYGAGIGESMAAPQTPLSYGAHIYSGYSMAGSYKSSLQPNYKHYGKDRYPFRKTSPPKRMDTFCRSLSPDKYRPLQEEKYPFRNNKSYDEPTKDKTASVVLPQDDIVIDEKLIAMQIAEVLTAQGRTDVSEEELRALINTVVENLKEEQRTKAAANDKFSSRDPVSTSMMAATAAVSSSGPSSTDVSSITAGFNLNSSTLALLQDAFQRKWKD